MANNLVTLGLDMNATQKLMSKHLINSLVMVLMLALMLQMLYHLFQKILMVTELPTV